MVRTYNSATYGAIRSTVQSVKQNVPVCHLVVVDRFSSDSTVEDILSVFRDAKVIRTKSMLGPATKTGFDACDTDIVAVVDDDVSLKPAWFSKMSSRMVGPACVASCNPFGKDPQIHFFASLFRQESIRGWVPAADLSAGENMDLQNFLLGNPPGDSGAPPGGTQRAASAASTSDSTREQFGDGRLVFVTEPLFEFRQRDQPLRYYYRKGRWEGAGNSRSGLSYLRTSFANAVYAASCARRMRFFKNFGLFPFLAYVVGETVGWAFPERYVDSTFRE